VIRTFIDAGVLIVAACGEDEIAERALKILKDRNREFASSVFLKLEVLPKATYNKRNDEVEFYEEFFGAVTYWANDIERIIQDAYQESCQLGLGAMDALHVMAAVSVGATEFITNEKPEKSIHRTNSIRVTSININKRLS
jgi:predicted nucleic acid-binding protein